MPQITLKEQDVIKLRTFCKTNGLETFFVAKDHGAYVGAVKGSGNNCLFYFKGCNPDTDPDFYDRQVELFGGDDFGEHLPLEWLEKASLASGRVCSITLKVSSRRISAVYK